MEETLSQPIQPSPMPQQSTSDSEAKKTGPRDVFLHLLAIITLYLGAVNFGVVLFQFINLYLPDPLIDNTYAIEGAKGLIRWAISALIIVFPIYLWVNRFLSKELIKIPEKKELRTRRWLLHFTIFATALVIIGDLISLIFNFLQGELTLRFALKILVILFIAGAVFGYYLWSLRKTETKYDKTMRIAVKIIISIVAAVIIGGFFVAGLPQSQRESRFDERRVSDLQGIQSQMVYFWQQKERLPQDLNELRDSISGYVAPNDPQTKTPYEYKLISDLEFELCANFTTKSLEPPIEPRSIPVDKYYYQEEFNNWRHDAGYICFQRKIDPELYKLKN